MDGLNLFNVCKILHSLYGFEYCVTNNNSCKFYKKDKPVLNLVDISNILSCLTGYGRFDESKDFFIYFNGKLHETKQKIERLIGFEVAVSGKNFEKVFDKYMELYNLGYDVASVEVFFRG